MSQVLPDSRSSRYCAAPRSRSAPRPTGSSRGCRFEVYTDFPGRRTWLTLDIGLVALANLRDWTSQVYGLGALGALADLSERNITLRLIGAKIVAYGAISGRLSGQIKALFYRHRSIGGYDDVSDFLIAPAEDGSAQTRPGDSGTLWHLETTDAAQPLRPLAIQWGGQTFMAGPEKASFNFALATSLSNVCRLLDVELVRDHNTGVQPYWGATGHYSIGAYACDAVRSEKLRTLMLANRDKISFQLAELTPDKIEDVFRDARQNGGFVPLAECRTWSGSRRHRGSRAGGRVE
ncbi:hypothetical protein [Ancylobacter dichloromethanicus]|uniref:hypothetical protein n=1 Tax=Ancylobacter dichloromethanicus TaxID=518825 RepID=UPI0036184C9B